MRKYRVAVIAGTSDATDLIASLPKSCEVTAFVATPYGKEILNGTNCQVHVGRLDADGFSVALTGFDAVLDASHPFAVVVTETVKTVCQAKQIPYYRIGRPTLQYDYEKLYSVPTKEDAAEWLSSISGNLFFTVGINTLPFYAAQVKDFATRSFARVLDTSSSHQAAQAIPAQFWFAMPPYSVEETVQFLRKHKIAVLISKDSGARGGVPEKIKAASIVGIPVLLIQSPEATISKFIRENNENSF